MGQLQKKEIQDSPRTFKTVGNYASVQCTQPICMYAYWDTCILHTCRASWDELNPLFSFFLWLHLVHVLVDVCKAGYVLHIILVLYTTAHFNNIIQLVALILSLKVWFTIIMTLGLCIVLHQCCPEQSFLDLTQSYTRIEICVKLLFYSI